ncbi:MAG: spiro-SPASM protein [Treponema sp.]|jgi:spiro-SPASM protein|nr:spiro-SPASM protein [Treponema sp.]
MNALAVLYGGNLTAHAFERIFSGKSALVRALEGAAAFPGVTKTVLLAGEGFDLLAGRDFSAPVSGFEILKAPEWTKKRLLDSLAKRADGFDLTYYAWADCPLLDPALAAAIMKRHVRYAAEYSYADGWPYGFSPELLAPGIAAMLSGILGNDDGPVERDALFQVIQKDINAFDIETEISPVDLRSRRLSLSADSKRNLLLLASLTGAGLACAADAERIIAERPELLRTVPRFYAVQTSGPCPRSCPYCPYPLREFPAADRGGFLAPVRFEGLLDKIQDFSGDAVIDLSLWGELALHPQKMELISMVLARPALSLIIETSGLGWRREELETLAAAVRAAPRAAGPDSPAPLSWIVSLDAADTFAEVSAGASGVKCAKTLMELFPKDAYVQAIRVQGGEDAIETFYRVWKDAGANVIIQKYDDFCGFLPKKQATDLSPVERHPCWHLMRDMNILIDGSVPRCREDLSVLEGGLGNAFEEALETLWIRGAEVYRKHCAGQYPGICGNCDEYYTFNF